MIHGLPMVEHVRRRVVVADSFADVLVATCDRPIAEAVAQYGGRAVMTSSSHPGALDRVAEVARSIDCSHVVNVQGDEILVLPDDLHRVVRVVTEHPAIPAWNVVAPMASSEELYDRSIVKVVVSRSWRVLFCARELPLHVGNGADGSQAAVWKSVGIMAYRRDFLLERYATLARTPLERDEAIDQLRLLEHDVPLYAVACGHSYPAINEPREVPLVERCLADDPVQRAVLKHILSVSG
jgi:3-deoxy-manno-octulosonate cytidylyltransferase (CMP-KDO synthetase)